MCCSPLGRPNPGCTLDTTASSMRPSQYWTGRLSCAGENLVLNNIVMSGSNVTAHVTAIYTFNGRLRQSVWVVTGWVSSSCGVLNFKKLLSSSGPQFYIPVSLSGTIKFSSLHDALVFSGPVGSCNNGHFELLLSRKRATCAVLPLLTCPSCVCGQ